MYWGCTLAFTLDPVYLHQLSSDAYVNGGGCAVNEQPRASLKTANELAANRRTSSPVQLGWYLL
jgi:hypothetical protein